MLAIKREYWPTFINTQRGKDLTMWQYHNAETDKAKAIVVFSKSRKHWRAIEDEVRDWVESSWESWVEGQPSWFRQEGIRANIPIEFIPNLQHRKKMRQMKRQERRRDSFLARGKKGSKANLRGSFGINARNAVSAKMRGRRKSITKDVTDGMKTLAKTLSGSNPSKTISPHDGESTSERGSFHSDSSDSESERGDSSRTSLGMYMSGRSSYSRYSG